MQADIVTRFAQELASNQNIVRNKALKKVGKWLERKSVSPDAFTSDGMLKLWKGLYYYFWHCDKPLVQEKTADVISKFIHNFKNKEYSFLYIDTFFKTMAREWLGIDRYRLEKYLMFIRRFLRQCFELLQMENWNKKWIKCFVKALKTVLSPQPNSSPLGLKTHMTDIFMEELALSASQELTPEILNCFFIPYTRILVKSEDPVLLNCVRKDIFLYLINQDADEKLYHEFPVLKFDSQAIQELLMNCAKMPNVSRKNLKIIYSIVKRFQDYNDDLYKCEMPVRNKRLKSKLGKRTYERAALSLLEEEEKFKEEKECKKSRKKRNADI